MSLSPPHRSTRRWAAASQPVQPVTPPPKRTKTAELGAVHPHKLIKNQLANAPPPEKWRSLSSRLCSTAPPTNLQMRPLLKSGAACPAGYAQQRHQHQQDTVNTKGSAASINAANTKGSAASINVDTANTKGSAASINAANTKGSAASINADTANTKGSAASVKADTVNTKGSASAEEDSYLIL